jgi:hypothetical protein
MRAALAGLLVLAVAGSGKADGPADTSTQKVPPLAWVRRVKPSKAARGRVTHLLSGGYGGVVAGLGRPDTVTRVNGFVVLLYRCPKGLFQFWFDQEPNHPRTFASYEGSR